VLLPVGSATKQQPVAQGKVHEVYACKRKNKIDDISNMQH
jgi:hypothetical protein